MWHVLERLERLAPGELTVGCEVGWALVDMHVEVDHEHLVECGRSLVIGQDVRRIH